jgi:hypothetical protein
VTEAGTDRPVRRALVTVKGAFSSLGESVATDADGRYTVHGLPAGQVRITAQREAFLPGAYGVTEPEGAAVPIDLTAGESRSDLDIVLYRGGVISGVITGMIGEPMVGMNVGAFRAPPDGRDLVMTQLGGVITDDRGAYRMFGLPPGEYIVAAMASALQAASRAAEVVTEEEIDRRLTLLASPGSLATPVRDAAIREANQFGVAPVFFPGVLNSAEAALVRVRAGDDLAGVDMQVGLTRLVTIDGIVHGAEAELASLAIFFNAPGRRLPPLQSLVPRHSSRPVPGGREFTYTGVPPGRYTITAATRVPSGGDGVFGQIMVTAGSDDVRGLSIGLAPMLSLKGRLVAVEADQAPPWAGASVKLATSNGMGQASANGTLMGGIVIHPAPVAADGTFEVRGIVPGSYTVTVTTSGGAAAWQADAVFVAGRDITGRPLDIISSLENVLVRMVSRRF